MNARRATLCLAAGQLIVWAGLYYIFPALLLRWEVAEAWPRTTLTAAFAGAVVVSALVSPAAGRLIDRGRGPHLMAGSALLGALLLALLPMAADAKSFTVLWLLIGIAMGGCLYEPCFAFVIRTRGDHAQRGITMITLVAGFAGTLSFPLNHAVAERLGWETATLVFACLLVTCAVPLLWYGATSLERSWRRQQADDSAAIGFNRVGPPPGVIAEDRVRRPTADVLTHPAFWLLSGAFSLLALNHSITLNHLLPILQQRGTHSEIAVLTASMIGPMQVAGRLAVMIAEKRFSSTAITTACFIAVCSATVCLYLASVSPVWLVVFVILQGSGFGVTSIMKPVVTRGILGEKNFGTITGLMAVPYLIAFALAPFLGSVLWKLGGYDLTLMVIGTSCLFGLVGFRIAISRSR